MENNDAKSVKNIRNEVIKELFASDIKSLKIVINMIAM